MRAETCRGLARCKYMLLLLMASDAQPPPPPTALAHRHHPCTPGVQGGDEAIFAKAFEAFDMLSRCLEEQNAPQQQELPPAAAAVAGTGAPTGLAPLPAAAAAPVASRPPADEPPLISFD